MGFRLQALLESCYSSDYFHDLERNALRFSSILDLCIITYYYVRCKIKRVMIHDCFVAQAWMHNDKYFTIDEFICFSLYHDRCFGCTRPYSSVVADDPRMAWEDGRQ